MGGCRLHAGTLRSRRGRSLAGIGAGRREAITAGIARTESNRDASGVDEVARLFEASINAASRFIYIENQFTSATEIARVLARRMVDVPSLRVLIVTPKAHSSWLEFAGDAGRPRRLHRPVRRRRRHRPAAHSLSVDAGRRSHPRR